MTGSASYPPAASEPTVHRRRDHAAVLVVDDDEAFSRLLDRLLSTEGYSVATAVDGPAALEEVRCNPPDVVLLDVKLPGLDGFEVCRRLKRDGATRLIPVILVTSMDTARDRVEGLRAGADDFLTKPVEPAELLARVAASARLKRYTDDLDSAASIIMTLAAMIEMRDGSYSEGHCHRMANYASALGRRLGLDPDELQTLKRGGFLHDIGMLAIPEAVICRDGALDAAEFEVVKSHTTVGDALCANLRSLQSVRPIVRHHHERRDGSGYPDRLRGDDIPLLAQITAIVDVFDAITTKRSYQGAKPVEDACAILRSQVECGWRRRDIVEEFIAAVLEREVVTP